VEVRSWVVITEPPLKAAVADLYRSQALPYLRARAHEPERERVGASALYLAENLERVPVLVLSCLEAPLDLSGNREAAPTYGSVMPAVWSFQLALRSRGLGSAWTTLHLVGKGERLAAEVLGIPYDQYRQGGLFPIAYTKGTDFRPAKRLPADQVTHWNAW
jgi:nitroreductase